MIVYNLGKDKLENDFNMYTYIHNTREFYRLKD